MSDLSRTDIAAPHRAVAVTRRASFEDFYAAELPRLTALARGLAPRHLAEDVAQEAMLVAYRRWREVGDLERPDLWVRRTCANLAVSQFRRRMVELRVTARLAGRRQTPVELSEQSEDFWDAVQSLPRRQAQAAALRFVYDMPIADIAATLGTSEGTIKQHLRRARMSLSRTLGVSKEEQ